MLLYYITDRKQLSADPAESARLLLERVRMAAEAGVDFIQLREKDLSARELTDLGFRIMEVVRKSASTSGTRVLINSRTDVAIACGADGVHLRSDDISPADARAVFLAAGSAQPVIAVSCHTAREVELAAGHGADFSVFGPVFGKKASDGVRTGIDGLAAVTGSARIRIPVLALGGITAENAGECIQTGAAGVAAIRLFQTGNISETVAHLRMLK